jgi:hypothetical protein
VVSISTLLASCRTSVTRERSVPTIIAVVLEEDTGTPRVGPRQFIVRQREGKRPIDVGEVALLSAQRRPPPILVVIHGADMAIFNHDFR